MTIEDFQIIVAAGAATKADLILSVEHADAEYTTITEDLVDIFFDGFIANLVGILEITGGIPENPPGTFKYDFLDDLLNKEEVQ